MQNIIKILSDSTHFPIMGLKLTAGNSLKLDFTAGNKDLKNLNLKDTVEFSNYVFGKLNAEGKDFGFGGYMEPRAIYQRSEVFGRSEEEFRNVHLGIDIWAKEGQPVYAPLDGQIHSFQDNGAFGNYGPAIILEHKIHGEAFYTLYGHLKRSDLVGLEKGQRVSAGEVFCHIGPYPENGDWPPHLHFQLILDLEGNEGDYPGVCAPKDMGKYQINCPNPEIMLSYGN
ncbi:peptidoglycan DD-metalloendopeptidase family protein [Echinicola shivajiensis]|uniref:peptidoglycan DD-metalloendopeptidase family protein n=1 Tax=Echinicola shivajiensis TaxID=1035916 RepID=UPI001BFC6757|nr:peptidoglycan DD-metalloendopeptidase family protein [Echinicola shivajiensis]